jgi:hypothetical protein
MVAMTFTQTDTVLGKLTNGRKLVLTVVTVTNGGLEAGTVTVKPLKSIVKWVVGLRKPLAFDYYAADQGTIQNRISITPSGDSTGAVLEILSVGV